MSRQRVLHRRQVAQRLPDDGGLSLIELVVYIVILGILMAGLTAIFVNMWTTQANVNAQTQATTRGQLVTSEIEKAMRNATGFQVADGGNTLLVQTSLAGANQCQAFRLDATGGAAGQGALQMQLSATPAPAPSAGYAWQDGIAPYADATFSAFFTYVDASGAPVALGGAGVHYSFKATAPRASTKSGAVVFTGTAFPRNATLGGTTACWS